MSKIYTLGFATLFAVASIGLSAVPASAHDHHDHHGMHWGHGGYWGGGGIYFDLAPVIQEEPVYCVDHRGRLYVCDYR